MEEPIKKWHGDDITCNFCHDVHDWFVDGKTVLGSWALMCSLCFKEMGVGLGVGKGQKYDAATLIKVEG